MVSKEERDAFEENVRREDEFMRRMGQAFAAWQSVEQSCYGIYAALMRGADKRLISVTFFHIQSFSSRLLLIDRCIFFAASDERLSARWTALRKRAEKAARLRNLVAHSAYVIEGKGLVQTPVLKPSSSDATAIVRKRAMNPDYRVDEHKLFLAGHEFRVLAVDLGKFREEFIDAGGGDTLGKARQ
jgi:hypothetical protein